MRTRSFLLFIGLGLTALGACQVPEDSEMGSQAVFTGPCKLEEVQAACAAKKEVCKEWDAVIEGKTVRAGGCFPRDTIEDRTATCQAENPCDCPDVKAKCKLTQLCVPDPADPYKNQVKCVTPLPGLAPPPPPGPAPGDSTPSRPSESDPNECPLGEAPSTADTNGRRRMPPKGDTATPPPAGGGMTMTTPPPPPPPAALNACICNGKTATATSTCATACKPDECAQEGKVCGIPDGEKKATCVAMPIEKPPEPPVAADIDCDELKKDAARFMAFAAICKACKETECGKKAGSVCKLPLTDGQVKPDAKATCSALIDVKPTPGSGSGSNPGGKKPAHACKKGSKDPRCAPCQSDAKGAACPVLCVPEFIMTPDPCATQAELDMLAGDPSFPFTVVPVN